MLTQLHIQNIAVISQATIRLAEGLNIFTGETGAGKTILISAIDAVLGERTSRDIIRTGEEKARVTALFEDVSPRALKMLEELGYSDDEGSILISREIHQNGKGNCKINGIPATASILKAVASLLIHIHGQRDSGQLLSSDQHIHLIDAYGSTTKELADYGQAYEALCAAEKELRSLEMDEAQKAQRIDMLNFQLEEIDAAQLDDPDEEDTLQAQRKMIKNSEKIRDALSGAYMAIRGNDEQNGLDGMMEELLSSAQDAAQYVPAVEQMAGRIEEMSYELMEYAQDIRSILDDFDFDPRELDEIESRLDLMYKLKRKYGASIAEILDYRQGAHVELETITTAEQRMEQLRHQITQLEKQTNEFGLLLRKKRCKAADAFVKQVEAELAFLDMPSVKLNVKTGEKPFSSDGMDVMEFFIVTNVGEEPKPLSKIASGGEVSRIMLAVKNVLAEKDDIATLIFDEIDTGVSGRAARKIGQKLMQLGLTRQVLCVTHLAQVAAFADHHLQIRKEVEDGRTFTRINELDEDGTIHELARITNGDVITPASLISAKELRQISRNSQI